MAVTWNVSLMIVSITWLFASPFATSGISPVPFRTVLVTSVAAAIVAALLHHAAAYVSALDPGFMHHQTVALGVCGSLAGTAHGIISRASEEFE
jgi:hypothetical protein